MVADEIIARADGKGGLKDLSDMTKAKKKEAEVGGANPNGSESASSEKKAIPFFASTA